MSDQVEGDLIDEQGDAPVDEQPTPNEATNEAPKAEEPKVEAPKFKLKANGQELELTQEELLRAAQKGIGAEKRLQEAMEQQKQVAAVLKLAKEDPKAFLSHPAIGHDVKAFVKQILQQELEEANLSEDQRKARKLEQELNALRQEQARQKEEAEQARLAQLTEHYQQELSNQIVEALNTSGLPKNEQTVSRIAQYMQAAIENGIEDVTAKDVLPYVRRDYELAIKSLLGVADEATLLNLLGDDITNKAVKAHLNKAKAKPAAPTPAPAPVKKGGKPEKKPLSQWRKEMDERFGDLGTGIDEYD